MESSQEVTIKGRKKKGLEMRVLREGKIKSAGNTLGSCLLVLQSIGRYELREALESALKAEVLFRGIIVSLNCCEEEVGHIFDSLGKVLISDVHVIWTGSYLSAVQHGAMIGRYMSKRYEGDYMMLLADDDRLSSNIVNLENYISSVTTRIGQIGLGSLEIMGEVGKIGKIDDASPITNDALEILGRSSTESPEINISSMIVPVTTYRKTAEYYNHNRLYGCRFELSLVACGDIEVVKTATVTTAKIRVHESQEGKRRSNIAFWRDELFFLLWVWKNRVDARPGRSTAKRYGFTLRRGVFTVLWLWYESVKVKVLWCLSLKRLRRCKNG